MNSKNIILGIVAIAALGGIVYFAATNATPSDQTGSALDASNDQAQDFPQENIDDYIIGNPDAPVTMIEYSSHFCGHCVNFHNDTLPLLVEKYVKNGQLKIIPRLVSPPELGMAVLCAQEQGQFEEFSDYLFKNGTELESVEDLKAIATILSMDQGQFDACYDNQKFRDKVLGWFDLADQDGVSGTPTFFINGEMITGNQPIEVFEAAIDAGLAQ